MLLKAIGLIALIVLLVGFFGHILPLLAIGGGGYVAGHLVGHRQGRLAQRRDPYRIANI